MRGSWFEDPFSSAVAVQGDRRRYGSAGLHRQLSAPVRHTALGDPARHPGRGRARRRGTSRCLHPDETIPCVLKIRSPCRYLRRRCLRWRAARRSATGSPPRVNMRPSTRPVPQVAGVPRLDVPMPAQQPVRRGDLVFAETVVIAISVRRRLFRAGSDVTEPSNCVPTWPSAVTTRRVDQLLARMPAWTARDRREKLRVPTRNPASLSAAQT